MNIENVISFIYIYRLKSFNKAAEELYITQPSLTSRINSLEKELDTSLLSRKRTGVSLTENGEIFLPYALQIFNAYLKAKNSINATEQAITVGSIISASTSLLPRAIYQCQLKNPRLSVKVITAKTATMLEKLLESECQIAITEKITDRRVISEPIYQDKVSLFVNPNHHFTNLTRGVTLQEVALEPMICFNPSSTYWNKIEQLFENQNLTPNVVFNVDSIESAKSAIISNIGMCFLPELSLEHDVANESIKKIKMQGKNDITREISISYLKNFDSNIETFLQDLRINLKEFNQSDEADT